MGQTEHCTWEQAGTTMVTTLNQPEARQAGRPARPAGLYDASCEPDTDDDARRAVPTGTGWPACISD